MELPKRKSNRLKNYNYSQNGAYFITICTHNKECTLGKIVGGGVLDTPIMYLSNFGEIVKKQIDEINSIYTDLEISKYIIMPNHIHFIIFVNGLNGTSRTPSPT